MSICQAASEPAPPLRVTDGRGGSCTGVEKVRVPIRQGGNGVANARQFNSFQ